MKKARKIWPRVAAATAPAGMPPAVFISYASQDVAVANAIVKALELCGLRCWIAPRDVIAGSLFAEAIVRALNEAKVFVLILRSTRARPRTSARRSSEHPPNVGRSLHCALIPEPLSPAFEYYLSDRQWIDLGSRLTDATVATLVDAVRRPPRPCCRRCARFQSGSFNASRAGHILMGIMANLGSHRQGIRANALRSIRSPYCHSH